MGELRGLVQRWGWVVFVLYVVEAPAGKCKKLLKNAPSRPELSQFTVDSSLGFVSDACSLD